MGVADPADLDPEERFRKFYALTSAALGVISLCAALIPICGGSVAILGIILGMVSLKSQEGKMAIAGIALSVLGLLISITYYIFLAISASVK